MSETESLQRATTHFECVVPILSVKNVRQSLEYYTGVLGFQQDWIEASERGSFVGLSRGAVSIYLSEGDQGQPGTWVWVGVGDAEVLYEEYKAKGARIRLEPTNYPWALEFRVEDPDGHILRFGSEPRADIPFAS